MKYIIIKSNLIKLLKYIFMVFRNIKGIIFYISGKSFSKQGKFILNVKILNCT